MTTATFDINFRSVKDSVGNTTLQPVDDRAKRATAFRQQIEYYIARARNSPDPIRAWFDIGPIEAAVLLEFSKGNRNEPPSTIAMYGRDIDNKVWHQTHQGFAFARGGWMGDGHHRCKALVLTKGTIRIAIDFGVADHAFAAVDMLRPRNIPDQLALQNGIRNGQKLVAAIRMCMALEADKLYTVKWSVAEVNAAIVRHKRAVDALKTLANTKYPASFWGAMLYAHRAAPAAVEGLAAKVIDGEGVMGPAYTLREYLAGVTARTPPFTVAQRTLYAARAFIERRQLSKFSPRDEHAIVAWFADRAR